MEQLITLVLFAGFPAGFLAAAHFVFQDREIQPPWTYVIGVGAIQIPLILWMLYVGIDPLAILGVGVFTAFIGTSILLCYWIDHTKEGERAISYVKGGRADRS